MTPESPIPFLRRWMLVSVGLPVQAIRQRSISNEAIFPTRPTHTAPAEAVRVKECTQRDTFCRNGEPRRSKYTRAADGRRHHSGADVTNVIVVQVEPRDLSCTHHRRRGRGHHWLARKQPPKTGNIKCEQQQHQGDERRTNLQRVVKVTHEVNSTGSFKRWILRVRISAVRPVGQ